MIKKLKCKQKIHHHIFYISSFQFFKSQNFDYKMNRIIALSLVLTSNLDTGNGPRSSSSRTSSASRSIWFIAISSFSKCSLLGLFYQTAQPSWKSKESTSEDLSSLFCRQKNFPMVNQMYSFCIWSNVMQKVINGYGLTGVKHTCGKKWPTNLFCLLVKNHMLCDLRNKLIENNISTVNSNDIKRNNHKHISGLLRIC